MDWKRDWQELATDTRGVAEAVQTFITAATASGHGDFHGVLNSVLIPMMGTVIDHISSFVESNRAHIEHADAILRFKQDTLKSLGAPSGFKGAPAIMAVMMALKTQVDSEVADPEVQFVPRIERAFRHLQRLIIADESTRGAWLEAFEGGETACERLGSNHLLAHAVWAFKANGPGARTDLVLGTALTTDDDAQAADAPLVLTEWKRVDDQGDVERKARIGQDQAKMYGEGILAGFELRRHRYVFWLVATTCGRSVTS